MHRERPQAAVAYARRGWLVFPCHGVVEGCCTCGGGSCGSPGKHPRTARGFHDASTDADQIEVWWHRWPDANIGIVTGAKSGLVVVDVDPRRGGDESLADLERTRGAVGTTPRCLTGGGGSHLYLAHPGDHIRSLTDFLPGIDLKADGGYIIAPPSGHASGRRYEWDCGAHPSDIRPAPAPAWLLGMIRRASPRARGPGPAAVIPAGQRNSSLASFAGSMRRRGMSVEAITAALLVENARRCQPPLAEDEVRGIAMSVGRYAPEPRVHAVQIEVR